MDLIKKYDIEELTDLLLSQYPKTYIINAVSKDIEEFKNRFDAIVRRELWLKFQEETSSLNSFTTSIRFLKSKVYQNDYNDYNDYNDHIFYKRYFLCWSLEENPREIEMPFYYESQIKNFLDMT